MVKKRSGSYRRERQLGLKEKHMTTHIENQDQELAALVQLRDEDIDTSDISEEKDWSRAVVGKFYRPIKAPVTLRIDVDVLVWLKSEGPGYQTRINDLLRTAMAYSGTSAFGNREAEGAAPELAVYHLYILLCANLFAGAGSYALEHANRLAFLERRLPFTGIAVVIERVLERTPRTAMRSIGDVLAADAEARSLAREIVALQN